MNGLVVDAFCGGGGASLGIEMALGRSPDIAINHDPEAIAMHRINHPLTRHYRESIYDVDPRTACGGRSVDVAWFSPDCTFHSRARGGKPFRDPEEARGRRCLPDQVVRWARDVRPNFIALENVIELIDWCGLIETPRGWLPDPERRGEEFNRWVAELKACGYDVEWRQLRACDYGAPTTRKRLFLMARCDGLPICWPFATHGKSTPLVPLKPYRTAAECIDWSDLGTSIFERKKPLAEKTLRRIARGLGRFVFCADPFVIPLTHAGDERVYSLADPLPTITAANRGEMALIAPILVQTGYGEREGQDPRALDIRAPIGTLVAGGVKHGLVAAFLAKHYGGHEATGSSLESPIDTITTQDHHSLVTVHTDGVDHGEEVRAFIAKFYGTSTGSSMRAPLDAITANGWKHALVTVHGSTYRIRDIRMRMLQPRELFRAQGFPDSYVIDPIFDGDPLCKTAQVRMVGNSAPPDVVAALIRANCRWEEREVAA